MSARHPSVPAADTPGPPLVRTPMGDPANGPARLEVSLRSSAIALVDWDLASGELVVTPGWAHQLGYLEHELPNDLDEWSALIHPEDRRRVIEMVGQFCQEPWNDGRIEFRMRHADGNYRWILIHGSALLDPEGRPTRIVAERVDITERKRAEALIAGQAQVLEEIARGAPLEATLESLVRLIETQEPGVRGSVLLLSPDGQHLLHGAAPSLPDAYNRAIDGIAIGEGIGSCGTAAFRRAPVIVADVETDPLWRNFRDLARAHGLRACWSTPILDRERNVLGTFALYHAVPTLPAEHHRALVECACRIASLAIVRQREENALRESERQLAAAQAQAHLGSWVLDVASRTGQWSAEMFRLFDLDPAHGVPTLDQFLELVHPDDRASLLAVHDRALATRETSGIEYRGNPARPPVRHFRAALAASGDPTEPVSQLSGTVLDITDIKRMELELREREAQILQAQKLESLGRLAAGVAHDFNNVLTVITAATELALAGVTPDERLRADMGAIADAAKRGADITRQLLMFARKQTAEPVAVDANQAIRSLSKMLGRLVGEDVRIVTELARDELLLEIDPIHFDQALVNLVTNARDAMGENGVITVETYARTVAADEPDRPAQVAPGDYVAVSVTDSGAGIAEDVRGRIFEPFFTTKPREHGTGLGLALVSGIVAKQGGFIDVRSETGAGARFTLHFPRWGGASPRAERHTRLAHQRGHETVLVAEDDPMLLTLVERTLRSFGYQVIAVDGATKAREQSRGATRPIDLLLTDTVMPVLDGKQLFRSLLGERPGLKVLYMSGYPLDELVRRKLLDEGDPFLQKPFTPSTLVERLRSILDAPGAVP